MEFTGMFRKDSALWIFRYSQKVLIVRSSSGSWHCVWMWTDTNVADEYASHIFRLLNQHPSCINLSPWRWRYHVPTKCQCHTTMLHSVKTMNFIIWAFNTIYIHTINHILSLLPIRNFSFLGNVSKMRSTATDNDIFTTTNIIFKYWFTYTINRVSFIKISLSESNSWICLYRLIPSI